MEKLSRASVLTIFLRLGGGVMILAFFAVIMPSPWMVETHSYLGLGKMPQAPIVDYLARTLSAFYVMHGGLYLMVASDLPRYRPIAVYLAWISLGFGIAVTWIDFSFGMPLYWSASEGPGVIGLACLMFWLVAGVERINPRSNDVARAGGSATDP